MYKLYGGFAYSEKQTIHFNPVAVTLKANEYALWKVFTQLLSNASKFSHSGAQIVIEVNHHPHHVQVVVIDQGVGLSEETSANLFEWKGVIAESGTFGEPSNGVGLALAKLIVEAHGGQLSIISKPKQGTSVVVTLPKHTKFA